MDYLKIVIQGYFNNRESLEKYFFREFKKAEKDYFFESDEFFSGLLKQIQLFKNDLQQQIQQQKNTLYKTLQLIDENKLIFNGTNQEIEIKKNETIKRVRKDLKNERPDGIGNYTYLVNLPKLSKNTFLVKITYDEVLFIENAINKAYKLEK